MNKLISIALFLTGLLGASVIPAIAQQQQWFRIIVYVHPKEVRGERIPLSGVRVTYVEPASSCRPRGGQSVSVTHGNGVAEFYFQACPGPATITVPGGSDYDTQVRTIEIAPGESGLNLDFAMEPAGRVLHIRVQGRLANGTLVPVPNATVYDRNNQQLATTGADGSATAHVKEVLGETVYLHAEAAHWRAAASSYIAGAYQSGSRLTLPSDTVGFVLNAEEEAAKQAIALQITVKGTKRGSTAPIEHALIYDENGRYLASTDSRGHASALVEEAFGETFRLKAEAQHWNAETQTLLARSETRNSYAGSPGSKYLYQTVRFTLSPATNEVGDLVVEVLDRDTDKPVPAAAVWLYKPTGFPGTLVGSETTNHNGEVTFDNRHVERALSENEARVSVKHGGYQDAVQTIAGSLTTTELPRYVVYLHPKKENTKWSGTWVEGPYTIQISGGTGSLGYNALRSEGVGTCCPLVDQSGGNCQVIGNKAICQYHGHYHDDAKDVTYGGHATLTLSGDYIQYSFTQVTGAITLASGQPCPDISRCTALHPGANFTGSWTRKKQ